MCLYGNTESPFETLPFTERNDLIWFALWDDSGRGERKCTLWEAERSLKALNAEQLALHIANMRKDRQANPRLYGRRT